MRKYDAWVIEDGASVRKEDAQAVKDPALAGTKGAEDAGGVRAGAIWAHAEARRTWEF